MPSASLGAGTGVTPVNSTRTAGPRHHPRKRRTRHICEDASVTRTFFTLPCTAGWRCPDPPTRGQWLRSVIFVVRVDPGQTRAGGGGMRILVLGGDGYLGWPTALHLSA